MANYLQRLITSGSRTSSPQRPPAAPPVLFPPIHFASPLPGAAPPPPADPTTIEGTAPPPLSEPAAAAVANAVRATGPAPLERALIPAEAPRPLEALPADEIRIPQTAEVRAPASPEPARPVSHPAAFAGSVQIRAPKALRAFGEAAQRPLDAPLRHVAQRPPTRAPGAASVSRPPVQSPAIPTEQPPAKTVTDTPAAATGPRGAEPVEARDVAPRRPFPNLEPIRPAAEARTELPRQNPRPVATSADTPPSPRASTEIAGRSPAAEAPLAIAAAAPAPQPQPRREAPPAPIAIAERARGRIRIGRIDVLVNNAPARVPRPAAPAPPRDRFPWAETADVYPFPYKL